jgi:hypothetical protein
VISEAIYGESSMYYISLCYVFFDINHSFYNNLFSFLLNTEIVIE